MFLSTEKALGDDVMMCRNIAGRRAFKGRVLLCSLGSSIMSLALAGAVSLVGALSVNGL